MGDHQEGAWQVPSQEPGSWPVWVSPCGHGLGTVSSRLLAAGTFMPVRICTMVTRKESYSSSILAWEGLEAGSQVRATDLWILECVRVVSVVVRRMARG